MGRAGSRLPGGWAGRPTWLVRAQLPGDLGPSCPGGEGVLPEPLAHVSSGWALEPHAARGEIEAQRRVGRGRHGGSCEATGCPALDPTVTACSRPYFSLQTFIFTDGEDEALAKRTGEPCVWGGRGAPPPGNPPLWRGHRGHGPGRAVYSTGLLMAPPPHSPPPIFMQMRPFQLPGPFELLWRQQVAGAGKSCLNGRGRGGAGRGAWEGLGWGGGGLARPGSRSCEGLSREARCCSPSLTDCHPLTLLCSPGTCCVSPGPGGSLAIGWDPLTAPPLVRRQRGQY